MTKNNLSAWPKVVQASFIEQLASIKANLDASAKLARATKAHVEKIEQCQKLQKGKPNV